MLSLGLKFFGVVYNVLYDSFCLVPTSQDPYFTYCSSNTKSPTDPEWNSLSLTSIDNFVHASFISNVLFTLLPLSSFSDRPSDHASGASLRFLKINYACIPTPSDTCFYNSRAYHNI